MLWGLSKDILLPVVRRAALEPGIADFSVSIRHEISGYKGYCAEKAIPTFCYRLPGGCDGEVTVFIKRMSSPGRSESIRYEALQALDLPLPRYYGYCLGEQGEDIVFMEFLEHIGLDPADANEARQLIQATARINSAAIPDVLRLGDTSGRLAWWESVLSKLWNQALAGNLGQEIGTFCQVRPMASLVSLAAATDARVSAMPHALNHNDCAWQNVGWRKGRAELLLFDLHRMGAAPRFCDFASIARGLEGESTLTRREIEDLYLQECNRYGRLEVSREELRAEVAWVERANNFTVLAWHLGRSLDGRADWTDDLEEGRRQNRCWLLEKLGFLWSGAGDA
jgi:hypothetical protein